MAKALLGHVSGPDPHVLAEVRRLRRRVRDLEAEIGRMRDSGKARDAGSGRDSGNGQGERHGGARSLGAGGCQLATVRASELRGDRQADTASRGLAGAPSTPEAVENAGQVLAGNAHPGIGDL